MNLNQINRFLLTCCSPRETPQPIKKKSFNTISTGMLNDLHNKPAAPKNTLATFFDSDSSSDSENPISSAFLADMDFKAVSSSVAMPPKSKKTVLFRGQDGIVSINNGIATKSLHPKLLMADPIACTQSVNTWNEVYLRLNLPQLATAKKINERQYEMPEIKGNTLENTYNSKENIQQQLLALKIELASKGINHSDLIQYTEDKKVICYNPRNIIYSEEYQQYLPVDMEGVSIMDTENNIQP